VLQGLLHRIRGDAIDHVPPGDARARERAQGLKALASATEVPSPVVPKAVTLSQPLARHQLA
jgi:hypothetical protein